MEASDESRCAQVLAGHTIILLLPNGDQRSFKLDANNTVNLGRYGSFFSNELIGQLYGGRYEVDDKKLRLVPPPSLDEAEDNEATNELINDGEFVQPLTTEEIETLKKAGAHASEIIKKQIEQHTSYELKTEYSKEKYKKRKVAKYSKFFTVLEPTLFNVAEYWFAKDQNRIRDLRVDTLSQMLGMGNVHPGGRYLVVDDVAGLLTSAVLERIGRTGRLIAITDVDGEPPFSALAQMNFNAEHINSVFSVLNWLTIQEDYVPAMKILDSESEGGRTDRQRSRSYKRKQASESLNNLRQEFFNGEFDGLLMASEYEPLSILDKLWPYLGGSANIVVYNPTIQVLADLQSILRNRPGYLGAAVTEAWLRRYQVLPGRTHPMMSMSGSGGYLLHAIKIYDNPAASSFLASRQRKEAKSAQLVESAAI